MKRSELKNAIETGIRITPDTWGIPCLIIDEGEACRAMAEAFEDSDPQDYKNQLDEDETKIAHSIYELNGKFYAVEEPYYYNAGYGKMSPAAELLYIECDNPETATGGTIPVYGKWLSFDDEDQLFEE